MATRLYYLSLEAIVPLVMLTCSSHTLLSNLGINTSRLSHEIAALPAATAEQSRPKRRKRLAPLGDLGPAYAVSDGDVGAWGRNWHEMVILSGIEVQRQKTVKSFQAQFQQRILSQWDAEKSRVLQDELGVTDDELARLSSGAGSSKDGAGLLGVSALGASRLGASTRRFPLAQSSFGKSTVEAREGGLVMHNKAMKYEKVVSTLNQRRLRKEPFQICQAFEQTAKGDQVSGVSRSTETSQYSCILVLEIFLHFTEVPPPPHCLLDPVAHHAGGVGQLDWRDRRRTSVLQGVLGCSQLEPVGATQRPSRPGSTEVP